MDSFFVLSGFLIAGILLDTRCQPSYYPSFFTRRALRIFPVYYALLIALTAGVILFGSGSLYPTDIGYKNWSSPWWFILYLGNRPATMTGSFPNAARNSYLPLWSVQIEEQFYLLFPFLVCRLRLETLSRTLLGLAGFSLILRVLLFYVYPANKLIQYVFLPCRMDGLAIGAWIAVRSRVGPWHLSRKRLAISTIGWAALTLICGILGGYHHVGPLNRTLGFFFSSIACGHVVVCLIAFRGTRLTGWTRLRPIQKLAAVSYGAYLFHMPITATIEAVSRRSMPALGQGHLKIVTVFIATVFTASISWQFFEKPILGLRGKLASGINQLTHAQAEQFQGPATTVSASEATASGTSA